MTGIRGLDATVVIPTRDRPATLGVAVVSAVMQRDVDVEVVVVDDGTTDATAKLLRRLDDPRVRTIANGGPQGAAGARNAGVAVARGRWIAFLDDDDAWASDKLSAQITALDREGARWAYTGYVTTDPALFVCDGSPSPGPAEVLRELRRHNAVPAGGSSVVVRRDLLEEVGTFDTSLTTSEDWDMWIRLAGSGAPAGVARPLVALRLHRRMASRDTDQMLKDLEVVAARHGLPLDRARHERWAAWMRLEDGELGPALRHYARAVGDGDVPSVVRAIVAVARPGVARRPCRGAGSEWTQEAQVWCAELLRRSSALLELPVGETS